MTQFEFDKLLEKYLAGECDAAEERLIEAWTERQITNAIPFPFNTKEETTVHKRLKRRIDKDTVGIWRLPFAFSVYRLSIAACLLGIIGLAGWFLKTRNAKRETRNFHTEGGIVVGKSAGFRLSNTTNIEQEFKLKDGSTITLKPQSCLVYLENFGLENRIVFLRGEGYFQIKRDTTKPFFVYAGNLVTKVLGTKFIVKESEEGKKAEVIVTSGKVMVYENLQGKVSKMVVLTPNQRVSYAQNIEILKPQIVEHPIVVNPIEKAEDFIFEKTPLTTVLSRLKNVYGVDILMKNAKMGQCPFTGNLNDLTLDEQLKFICAAFDGHIQRYETTIWIDGEGCF